MQNNIDLKTIFRLLLNNENFMNNIIDTTPTIEITDMNRTIKFPYQAIGLKNYDFPEFMKRYLFSDDIYRLGVLTHTNIHKININVSFISTIATLLNIMDLWNFDNHDDILKETVSNTFYYIEEKISVNHKIDRKKKTQKTKKLNSELVDDFSSGIINDILIKRIIDIFEINILVFDIIENETKLYFTCGTDYEYFNIYKNIYMICKMGDFFEPIMCEYNENIFDKIYISVIKNIKQINVYPKLRVGIPTIYKITKYDLDLKTISDFILSAK